MLLLMLGAVSCSDGLDTNSIDVNTDQTDSINDMYKENLYLIQSDKERILNSFIRYNRTQKRYELDLSDEDAVKLSISKESYLRVQKSVRLMNEANIKHQ